MTRLGWGYEVKIIGMNLREGFVKKNIDRLTIFNDKKRNNLEDAREYIKQMEKGNFVLKAKQIPIYKEM